MASNASYSVGQYPLMTPTWNAPAWYPVNHGTSTANSVPPPPGFNSTPTPTPTITTANSSLNPATQPKKGNQKAKSTPVSDDELKNHPIYKNMLSQLEVCRGTNVTLSNKVSRLEESIRILESKNLYLQDEN